MHACMYVCMYVCMCVCVYVWMDGMDGCMHVCMYVWMDVCMYVRIGLVHLFLRETLGNPATPKMENGGASDSPKLSKKRGSDGSAPPEG